MRPASHARTANRSKRRNGLGRLSYDASPMPASRASTMAWDRVLTPSLAKMLET